LHPTFDFPDIVDIKENSALVIKLFNISYTPNAGIAGALHMETLYWLLQL